VARFLAHPVDLSENVFVRRTITANTARRRKRRRRKLSDRCASERSPGGRRGHVTCRQTPLIGCGRPPSALAALQTPPGIAMVELSCSRQVIGDQRSAYTVRV